MLWHASPSLDFFVCLLFPGPIDTVLLLRQRRRLEKPSGKFHFVRSGITITRALSSKRRTSGCPYFHNHRMPNCPKERSENQSSAKRVCFPRRHFLADQFNARGGY